MNILKYLDAERVTFLEVDSRNEALKFLTKLSKEYLYNEELFYNELIKREELMSTGLGSEIAFPHSKNPHVIDFFLTIGVARNGIDWNSFDGQNVKLIFLIGGLVEEHGLYLKILATLSTITRKIENKEALLKTKTALDFYHLFAEIAMQENQSSLE